MTHSLTLMVHAVPGARRTEAAGAHGDALRVRLAAPALEGRANAALIAWAARAFGIAPRAVRLASGEHSRRKRLQLQFQTKAELQQAHAILQRWMA